ncbi:hypothetical protein GW796_05520 [archaeon]|nr:hypothetical protein [archaeon]NCQ51343.1 hypothetical protein [archaeon]NCT58831.1 hypothetical protein [archaeon]
MKIDVKNDLMTVIELETAEGQCAFFAGKDDHRHWQRSPETIELSQFCQDNRKSSQLVVKTNDCYTRIK